MIIRKSALAFALALSLTGCATEAQNHQLLYTGVGTGLGIAAASLINAPSALTILAAIAGGGAGYYLSTPQYQAQKVQKFGGTVYKLGDSVTVILPADAVFEPASSRYAEHGRDALAELASIIQKYPEKNILVTANTSGINAPEFEQPLSVEQAKQVANFLWANGVNDLEMNATRTLQYAGLGNKQPIADPRFASGVAHNRRIQVTLYGGTDLSTHALDGNIGAA